MKLIKTYNFWVSLSGAVGLLAVSIGKVFGVEIAKDGVSEIIMSICGVLIVFGIVTITKNEDDSKEDENKNNEG